MLVYNSTRFWFKVWLCSDYFGLKSDSVLTIFDYDYEICFKQFDEICFKLKSKFAFKQEIEICFKPLYEIWFKLRSTLKEFRCGIFRRRFLYHS